ncbi:sugar phosphate isomerase/epimerase family protein [bacterium]
MKLGCCSWSYHRNFESGDMDLFDWMTVCARDLKVGGIEITDGHMKSVNTDYVRQVRRVAVDLHLTISGYTVSNDFGKATKEERDGELEKLEAELIVAAALGAPVLRVFAGWPATDKEQQWAEMVRYMKISTVLAEREGVVLAVENHNHGGFLQTFKDVERLLRDVDSEWLRLNLDTGNYIDGWTSIEKSMLYNVHTHAKMMNIDEDGFDTTCDYPRFAELLRETNYRGFICVEYEGEEEEAAAVPRGVNYLRSLLMKD